MKTYQAGDTFLVTTQGSPAVKEWRGHVVTKGVVSPRLNLHSVLGHMGDLQWREAPADLAREAKARVKKFLA